MTREEIFAACQAALTKSNVLLLESATGTGKSKCAIDLINWISGITYKGRRPRLLLLVAKTVHKQTWIHEFEKWGGINAGVTMECYESLHKHKNEFFDFVLPDEVHHLNSELRRKLFRTLQYGYIIGLSATIPLKLKQWFSYNYHPQIVSCDIVEAIDSEVLPEPTVLLFPLQIETSKVSEILELHPHTPGPTIRCEYDELWKYKFKNVHIICRCTQEQKLRELNGLIDRFKQKALSNPSMKKTWLYFCGKRLEFLADCKINWIKLILHHLDNKRTITFCKTIAQTEQLGKNCIHSQNKDATKIYDDFNNKKIDHITAVNILNENANLVDCQYGIFCNITSSEIITAQRQGRLLRHKNPVMIIPYYKGTREEELVMKGIEGFKQVKTINSINEI